MDDLPEEAGELAWCAAKRVEDQHGSRPILCRAKRRAAQNRMPKIKCFNFKARNKYLKEWTNLDEVILKGIKDCIDLLLLPEFLPQLFELAQGQDKKIKKRLWRAKQTNVEIFKKCGNLKKPKFYFFWQMSSGIQNRKIKKIKSYF